VPDDKHILLVEDHQDDVFLMRRALKLAGVTSPLFVVGDGEEAVEYLEGTSRYSDRTAYPLPALMFLDLMLPLKSGHEVLEWTRRNKALESLIIIVLASSEEQCDIARSYQLGANSYLVKPPTTEALLELAAAFNLDWLAHNKSARSNPA
jgi:CheY-like chemotaxis protein